MKEKRERVIKLSKLDADGVIIERGDDFWISPFCDVYEKAKQEIEYIIQKNMKESKRNRSVQGETNNVVSFVGRRGTGKTSAMLSVRQKLEEHGKSRGWNFTYEDRDVNFFVLDYISASLVERSEGISELILANMFSKLLEFDRKKHSQWENEHEGKELYRQFEQVYGSLMAIKNRKEQYGVIPPLRVLNELSGSQNLGKEIKKLVEAYLEYMRRNNYGYNSSKSSFLVISVDDIDMNLHENEEVDEGLYEMLENLHRYFMLPNVIILLTYHYPDLSKGCEKHFQKMFSIKWEDKETGQKSERETAKEKIKTLTTEYLNKVVPTYSRIYMPSLRKKDYDFDKEAKVRVDKEKMEREKFDNFLSLLGDSDGFVDLSIKKFALFLQCSVTDLYYDANGDKRHRSVPLSLRELGQFYRRFQQYNELIKSDKKLEDIVFKELLDDLYFRYSVENLNAEEQEKLKKYLDYPIERRGKELIRDIREMNYVKKDEKLQEIRRIREQELSYGYGEFLLELYIASQRGLFSKAFIWCILSSYTIVLTKEYRTINDDQDDKNMERRKRSRQKFNDVMGVSAAGGWANLLVPKVQLVKKADREEEMGQLRDYRVMADTSHVVDRGAAEYRLSVTRFYFELNEKVSRDSLKNDLQIIEILAMFFTNVSHRSSGVQINEGFEISMNLGGRGYRFGGEILIDRENSVKKKGIQFSFESSDMCFNIMNFMNNLLDWDGFFERLHSSLESVYEEYFDYIKEENRNLDIDDLEDIKSFLQNNSLKEEYDGWYQTYEGFAVPLYSCDLMYNLWKHAYQNQGIVPVAVMGIDFWEYVKKAYVNIGTLLKCEEEYYFQNENLQNNHGNYRFHFYQAYINSPFIDYIFKLQSNPTLEQKFKDTFTTMVYSLGMGII